MPSRTRTQTHLVENLQNVDITWFITEMRLEEVVYRCLEHEGVINGDVSDALDAEPARLAAAREGLVHDVVCDEEECLELSRRSNFSNGCKEGGKGRTSSTHQPRMAALKYSSSDKDPPLRISAESTTDIPRLSFPPGTLWSRFYHYPTTKKMTCQQKISIFREKALTR